MAVELTALTEAGGAPETIITRALRQAAMSGALAYFRDADAATPSVWSRARRLGVPYLRGVRHPTGEAQPIELAHLPIEARLVLWRATTDAPPPPALIAQRLTPAEIVRGAATPGAPLKHRQRRPDHALLTMLPTPYEWDELVLPFDVISQLRAFESQVRLRWSVYEDWGLLVTVPPRPRSPRCSAARRAPARPWRRKSWPAASPWICCGSTWPGW